MKTWTITSLAELSPIVNEVASSLIKEAQVSPVVLALHGDLGAGKTTFTQLLATTLGVTDAVTSPTFVIMKRYSGAPKMPELVHIDAYRIETIDEMVVLGFVDLLKHGSRIVCVEWAERIATLLPEHTRHLTIAIDTDGQRTLTYSHA